MLNGRPGSSSGWNPINNNSGKTSMTQQTQSNVTSASGEASVSFANRGHQPQNNVNNGSNNNSGQQPGVKRKRYQELMRALRWLGLIWRHWLESNNAPATSGICTFRFLHLSLPRNLCKPRPVLNPLLRPSFGLPIAASAAASSTLF